MKAPLTSLLRHLWAGNNAQLQAFMSEPDRLLVDTKLIHEPKHGRKHTTVSVGDDEIQVSTDLANHDCSGCRGGIDSESNHVSEPEPGIVAESKLEHRPAREHARLLLQSLQASKGHYCQEVFADELRGLYLDMCVWLEIQARPWNSVANEFAKLVRQPGKPLKTFGYKYCPEGKPIRRARIYRIPERKQADVVDISRRRATDV